MIGPSFNKHARATQAHHDLMNQYGVVPIGLTRNIYDVVVSLVDYFDSSPNPKMFLCYTAPQYADLSREDKISIMVELAVPWYSNFYVGWWDTIQACRNKGLWLTYEQVIADPEKAVASIIDFTGSQPLQSVADAISSLTSKSILLTGEFQGVVKSN
jgi:hypothetical protein